MQKERLLTTLIVFAIAAVANVRAETPEEFSNRYTEALRGRGMGGVIEFLHPEETKKLSELVVEISALSTAAKSPIPFLGPGETVDDLKKMPAEKVAEKFFNWINQAAPQLTEALKTANSKAIGHVADGDTLYVVSKLTLQVEGESIVTTDVLPMKKIGEDYKVLLKGDITTMLKAMKKRLEAQNKK